MAHSHKLSNLGKDKIALYNLHSPTTPTLEGLHLQQSVLTPPGTDDHSDQDASPQSTLSSRDSPPSTTVGFSSLQFSSTSFDLMDIAAMVNHRSSQVESRKREHPE